MLTRPRRLNFLAHPPTPAIPFLRLGGGGRVPKKDHELRFSDTNSADDSAGKTWGLDRNLFWFVVAGVFLFVVTLLLLFSALRCSFVQSFSIALIPLGLTIIYVFGFRQGKPPAYDLDLVDYWTNGAGFGPNAMRGSAKLTTAERSLHSRRSGNPRLQPQHPFSTKSDVAD